MVTWFREKHDLLRQLTPAVEGSRLCKICLRNITYQHSTMVPTDDNCVRALRAFLILIIVTMS
jgi:hypothetical protein